MQNLGGKQSVLWELENSQWNFSWWAFQFLSFKETGWVILYIHLVTFAPAYLIRQFLITKLTVKHQKLLDQLEGSVFNERQFLYPE